MIFQSNIKKEELSLLPKQSKQMNQKESQNKLQKQNKSQTEAFQSKTVINMFLKNQTLKDKNTLSNMFQAVTEIGLKIIQTFKIKPVMLINKIQQSRPHYKNSIVNKELAYDILLQTQNTVKIKNCISPSRPNSQIYKRLSKNFFENIKNGIDQCLLFTGTESGARVQSSIGNQSNPGIFMIVAIAILDQKYKKNHERFDAQFSFLEYRAEKMYDLINFTEQPLTAKSKQITSVNHKVHNIEFGQHYVKVCTFLQFIRLFKIALFNNKERDIKTNKQKSVEDLKSEKSFEYTSSFIMKIRIKKYDIDSILIFEQETMLIDLDENSSLRSNTLKNERQPNQSQKQLIKNQKRTSETGSRSLLDFILIEINNSNPLNKPIHYHMVEKNLLLQVLKKYLRLKQSILPKNISSQHTNNSKFNQTKQQAKQYQVGGYLFIINSFTTHPFVYEKNIKLYQNLTSSIGQQWEGIVKVKNVQRKGLSLGFAQNILNQIVYTLKNQKYTSFRDLYAAKQFYTEESKKIISDIKAYRSLILDYSNQKKNLSYNKNLLTAYQLQLIGKCIKSDNFKQFYTSKSYLALPRQIQIKTQKIKTLIKDQMQNLQITQEKFSILKKKQHQSRKSHFIPEFVKNSSFMQEKLKQKALKTQQKSYVKTQKTKFKMINRQQTNEQQNFNDFQKFHELKKYVYDYFNEIWSMVVFEEQRTITQQFIFEDNQARDIRNFKQSFKIFIKQIQSVDETKIKYFCDEQDSELQNLNKLMRSVNLVKKNVIKSQFSPKFLQKKFSTSQKSFKIKKQNLSNSKIIFPKIFEADKFSNKKNKTIPSNHSQVIQIKAKVNFGSLLLNPKKLP